MEWIAAVYKDQAVFVSWLISLLGTFLILFPTIITWKFCKNYGCRWRYTVTLSVFGAFALPLSFWLYFQYFLGPIRALLFGFIGLAMLMAHMAPLEMVDIPFLLKATDTESGDAGSGISNHLIAGGLLWAVAYGALGFVTDFVRLKRSSDHSRKLPQ